MMVSILSSFQTQLTTIMEALVKTAILEISELVDVECKVLQLEVSRSRSEIGELRKRLKLMELQPWTAHPQRQVHDDARTSTEQKRYFFIYYETMYAICYLYHNTFFTLAGNVVMRRSTVLCVQLMSCSGTPQG